MPISCAQNLFTIALLLSPSSVPLQPPSPPSESSKPNASTWLNQSRTDSSSPSRQAGPRTPFILFGLFYALFYALLFALRSTLYTHAFGPHIIAIRVLLLTPLFITPPDSIKAEHFLKHARVFLSCLILPFIFKLKPHPLAGFIAMKMVWAVRKDSYAVAALVYDLVISGYSMQTRWKGDGKMQKDRWWDMTLYELALWWWGANRGQGKKWQKDEEA